MNRTYFKPHPPNKDGKTNCVIRWMMETPNGWVGSWDKAALEQFVKPADEPVAWMYDWDAEGESVKDWLSKDYDEAHSPSMGCHNIRPLYTRPQPAREWTNLTFDEIYAAIRPLYCDDSTASRAVAVSVDEYRAIEKVLKEKNT